MLKITSYIKRYWYLYFAAIACLIISTVLNLLSPFITKKIIDDVIMKGKVQLLTKLLILIAIIGVSRCIFQYIKELLFDYASVEIATDMRKHLFTHIQSLSVNFFDKTNTGEIMSRVKDDVNSIWDALSYITMLLVEVAIHTVIIIVCMLKLDWKLTLIPLIIMPIAGFIAIYMEKKLDTIYDDISEENARLTTVAQENIAGVRTVKSFAREAFEVKKFLSHNQRYYDLNMKQSNVLAKFYPIFMFISKTLPLIVIILGGIQVANKSISLGTLGAFVEYSFEIVWPMEMLGWLLNSFSSAIASNKKLKKIYSNTPLIEEKEHPTKLDNVHGHITFDHVDFSLDGKDILKDISFDIAAGKTIGIMGATGTGKTSIINLLQRFYDVTNGSIQIDGVDIKELSLSQLRSNISTVMQDVFLFSDTINENIKLGQKSRLEEEHVVSASSLAQANHFIEKMDEKYETIIGERGIGLSGGQKQRISIARALVKSTPILIMDDSTSALDMETEYQIQQSLNTLQETTKIIIAHRISAVRNADEIIILNNGTITERGTHESLMKENGYYYQTFLAQYGNNPLYQQTLQASCSQGVCNT